MPVFGNPLGLLALLGIPVVLAIHFLQRKAKELPVSTLFLLDHTRREAAGGRRFERLIPSIPLWMQLLAVCLLAWYLSEPRHTRSGSVQRVAIVVDSSASMAVFKDASVRRLLEFLPTVKGGAELLETTVLDSEPNRPRIYTGSSLDDLGKALAAWHPHSGRTDPAQSLRLARSLVSRTGVVIYLTDTPENNLPFGAIQLSTGEPVDNVGFAGVSFAKDGNTTVWRALVRNHGKLRANRTWKLVTSDGSSDERPIEIDPGAMVTLQAAMPTTGKNVRIVLSPDRFPLDDVLPIVEPKPKPLTLNPVTTPALAPLAGKLIRALDATGKATSVDAADLSIITYDPKNPATPDGNCIVFIEDPSESGSWMKGGIVAEQHPLMDGINWQSLLVRESIQLDRKPSDTVLLWQEKRPLILLRETNSGKQLRFNFDPKLSNAERQPAFIVLLHRFCESVRSAKTAPCSLNLECGQEFNIASAPNKPIHVVSTNHDGSPSNARSAASQQRAMSTPGFFRVEQDGVTLLHAAVHFGDPRESDFSKCAPANPDAADLTASTSVNTEPDPLWRLWILLMIAALIISWKFTTRAVPPSATSSESSSHAL